jgi:hypothetical protein
VFLKSFGLLIATVPLNGKAAEIEQVRRPAFSKFKLQSFREVKHEMVPFDNISKSFEAN